MGNRDVRKRETKKQKKDAKKPAPSIALTPTADVQVVPKGKARKEPEE
jgi:hypothetical protein